MALAPTISISQIINHFAQPVVCIKLDIEGAEADLFLHDAEVMKSIPAVIVELQDRIIEGTTDAFRQCFLNANIFNEGPEKYLVTRN